MSDVIHYNSTMPLTTFKSQGEGECDKNGYISGYLPRRGKLQGMSKNRTAGKGNDLHCCEEPVVRIKGDPKCSRY